MPESTTISPATENDLYLYRGIFTNTYCLQRKLEISFENAITVSSIGYLNVLKGKHGSQIQSLGATKLEDKQLTSAVELQILSGAMEACSEFIPEDIQKKVSEIINAANNKEEEKKKKGFFD